MLSLIYLRINDPKYEPLYQKPLFIILVILALSSCLITFIGSILILAMYYYAQNTHNMWELWNCLLVLGGMLSGYPLYYVKKWCAQKLKTKKQKDNISINGKENGESFTK
ncbi:hypothetical protein [Spiroplasma endosymbiont of Poecilobothrus nobilitatus]|uniref:hypothetical protein n=1 Tax=Spiroplasma endosymbiont of Poecilobothrus nobilitatus TaxID=1209220 RepID=UPI00313B07D4